VLNTFVSIRTFAAITPKNAPQNIFDLILALTYAALAFTVDSVLRFSLLSTALFVVAALKYIHLRSLIVIERRLIARKILLNSLGAGLSSLAFIITLWGSANVAAWTLSLTFTLANVYLLFVRPMYRLDQEDNGV
ncbi:hypothetical protein HY414_00445, partial [Candidatus Kaiserbacteria bacterium]|nr:hypothetical protein [Candidatus Kaiserbacteria bacterium]